MTSVEDKRKGHEGGQEIKRREKDNKRGQKGRKGGQERRAREEDKRRRLERKTRK